jgi:hypothetical protein
MIDNTYGNMRCLHVGIIALADRDAADDVGWFDPGLTQILRHQVPAHRESDAENSCIFIPENYWHEKIIIIFSTSLEFTGIIKSWRIFYRQCQEWIAKRFLKVFQ